MKCQQKIQVEQEDGLSETFSFSKKCRKQQVLIQALKLQKHTDTPVSSFSTIVDPDTVRSGRILQIRIKLNWTNAVTLEAFRLWEAAKSGDYESNGRKIFDSDEYVASLNDDEEYVFNVDIPFKLDTAGTMYYAPQWSAACGNIQGQVTVKGEVYQ